MIGGDFRQIPPVLRRVDPENTRAYTLRCWEYWTRGLITKLHFQQNVRVLEDPDWAKFVLSIGDGTYKGFTVEDDTAKDTVDPAAV